MNIRFTSSLTPDDENRITPVILQAISAILNALPIAYMIRVDTSDSQVYQVSGSGSGAPRPLPMPTMPSRVTGWES